MNTSLVWSRGSSARFRTGSYSVQAHTITLPTIGLGDAGYYHCSATDQHNQTHTATIQVQVGLAQQATLSLLATLFNMPRSIHLLSIYLLPQLPSPIPLHPVFGTGFSSTLSFVPSSFNNFNVVAYLYWIHP